MCGNISKSLLVLPDDQTKALQKGSKVGIVATARAAYRKDLSFAVNWLNSCGYEVVFADNIDESCNQFAGDDEMRIDAFRK